MSSNRFVNGRLFFKDPFKWTVYYCALNNGDANPGHHWMFYFNNAQYY